VGAGDPATSVNISGTNGPRVLSGVANGVAPTDAVNVGQLSSATTTAVQAANVYTDNSSARTLTSANSYTNQQVGALSDQLNQRVGALDQREQHDCAMASASSGIALAGSGADSARLVAGTGLCSGGAAGIAVGLTVPLSERIHAAFGASASGGQGMVNAAVGVDLW
jgi:hypothetical protein